MKRFIVKGNFKGFYNKAFSIAHCQVSETPMSFFVVSPECMAEKMFAAQVVINPEIMMVQLTKKIGANGRELSVSNEIEYQEPCMSFPFRKPKTVRRYDVISVRYQVPGVFGLKTITENLSGIASEIFQHEYDHTKGKNIYFESEQPTKWWELIGTEKSKGGTSLDDPAELGLVPKKEKTTKDFVNHNIIML